MLRTWGTTIARFWPALIAAWAVLVGSLAVIAPRWDEVSRGGEFAFLPDNLPSRRAERLLALAFREQGAVSSLVVVARRLEEEGRLLDADWSFLQDTLAPAIEALAESPDGGGPRDRDGDQEVVLRVLRPGTGAAGELLVSDDGRAALVVIDFSGEFLEARVKRFSDRVAALIDETRHDGRRPAGMELSLTGNAAVGQDYLQAQRDSARSIERWTGWLVVALLLLVFRAPLAALIPLVTLSCGLFTALKLLALMAGAGMIDVFDGLEVYTGVLVYGAGVDYGMFLMARVREELGHGRAPGEAVAEAIARVGTAISASAATAIVGIGLLMLAQFGKFQQAGLTIAFGLLVMWCASLSLTPALLCLVGRWAFWPADVRKVSRGAAGRVWRHVGLLVVHRPVAVGLVTLLALTPPAVYGFMRQDALSYGLTAELPSNARSLQSTARLAEHFPIGQTGPITVLLRNAELDFSRREAIEAVREFTEALAGEREHLRLGDIRSVAEPLGRGHTVSGGGGGARGLVETRLARARAVQHYVASGEGGRVTRIELIPDFEPLSREAIGRLDEIEAALRRLLPAPLAGSEILLLGVTASTRDLRSVAERDRRLLLPVVTLAVFIVLVVLLRQLVVPAVLVSIVVLSYLVALGTSYAVFSARGGAEFAGLDWTVSLFLFTVLMAVGADYNVLLVTRVDEERARSGIKEGLVTALGRTGSIISSCGFVMAGTFFSLTAGGTLAGFIQLGFALALGVLLITFVALPLLAPSFLAVWYTRRASARVRPAPEGGTGEADGCQLS